MGETTEHRQISEVDSLKQEIKNLENLLNESPADGSFVTDDLQRKQLEDQLSEKYARLGSLKFGLREIGAHVEDDPSSTPTKKEIAAKIIAEMIGVGKVIIDYGQNDDGKNQLTDITNYVYSILKNENPRVPEEEEIDNFLKEIGFKVTDKFNDLQGIPIVKHYLKKIINGYLSP